MRAAGCGSPAVLSFSSSFTVTVLWALAAGRIPPESTSGTQTNPSKAKPQQGSMSYITDRCYIFRVL